MTERPDRMTPSEAEQLIRAAFAHRVKHGRHVHHSACIHNLPPEDQVAIRGKSVEWWTTVVGPLPEQITPDKWEVEPPDFGEEDS